MTATSTHGNRIRELFANAKGTVSVIAPFVRVTALKSLLDVIAPDLHVRCVTRWLPREVAAGVSEPEILDLLEGRGNFSLSLVDRLHAKVYIAGARCLAGSSNVTFAGLGEADSSNIEVLVETSVDDPSVAATLAEISQAERPATQTMARATRQLAACLLASGATSQDPNEPWFPTSQRPQDAYSLYSRSAYRDTKTVDRILMADLAKSNLPPGLGEDEFRVAIRSLLTTIPIIDSLLSFTEDTTLTRAEVRPHLETFARDNFSVDDLWNALVNWMAYFFPDQVMKQEISDVGLRRAQLLER